MRAKSCEALQLRSVFDNCFKNKEGLVHEVLQTYLEAIRNGDGP